MFSATSLNFDGSHSFSILCQLLSPSPNPAPGWRQHILWHFFLFPLPQEGSCVLSHINGFMEGREMEVDIETFKKLYNPTFWLFWSLTSFWAGNCVLESSLCPSVREALTNVVFLWTWHNLSPQEYPPLSGKCSQSCQQSLGDVFTFLKVRKLIGVIPIPQELFPLDSFFFLGGGLRGAGEMVGKPKGITLKSRTNYLRLWMGLRNWPYTQAKNKGNIWEILQQGELIISSLYLE